MNTSSRRSSGSEAAEAPSAGRRAGAAALALLLAAAAAPVAVPSPVTEGAAPWHELYRLAVADAELENWAGVEEKILRALKEKPGSERNVRTYGMWHASYIPYYYLGRAQYHMGRPQEALKSLEREQAAGVVQHDPVAYLKLRKTIDAIRSSGAPRPGEPARPPAPAPSPERPAPAGGDKLVEGLSAFFQGDYDRSIESFQDELKRAPEGDLTLHLYLGMAYAGKSQADPGRRDLWRNLAFLEFRRVTEIDPNYALASGVFSTEMMTLFEEARKKP